VWTPEHARLARAAAAQGIVLLRNAGNILPLDPTQIHSIAVIVGSKTAASTAR